MSKDEQIAELKEFICMSELHIRSRMNVGELEEETNWLAEKIYKRFRDITGLREWLKERRKKWRNALGEKALGHWLEVDAILDKLEEL